MLHLRLARSWWKQLITAMWVVGLFVFLSYHLVDRQLVDYVDSLVWLPEGLLYRMQRIPELFLFLSPIAVCYLAYRHLRKKNCYFDLFLRICCISLIITVLLKIVLKFVFARTWPASFIDNASYLRDGVYGFHFFTNGGAYQSFPSGHTAVMFTVAAVIWAYYPKWRIFAVVMCFTVVVGLLGLNYHFLSDVVAGAFLGIIVALAVLKNLNSMKSA